ncbi:M56 family metallopeptidase [Ferruginibacter sp. HRS2-29]|uniref:M56 family metallopeptidase n=1 Tax=Ferruginibacter sp. HRS2-29 TaxID=2487334 RepID=UPI0020CDE392|nr:M56 family metallopeptidase [Ferruginibacter sp. HRS2-29]MCP9753416.1 M56 family metallopeptidase [Ferruginibacter sp. HRS2-29]
MGQFSYSFAVSMMHSIWQSAVLLGLYYAIILLLRNPHPLFKRNLLFGMIAVQLMASLATFSFYYNGSFASLQSGLYKLLPSEMPARQWLQQYAPWIFYLYVVVVIIRSAIQLRSWLDFKSNYSLSLVKPPVDTRMFTTSKAHQFGIVKKVTLWYSTNIQTPIVFGFFKPVILLPVALVNQLSVSETEALIIHELTHIRYNDYLLNWLLLATETVYFFNPFLRIMAGKIKLEREKNCDIQVLQFNYCTIGYADALLKTARLRQRVKAFQLAAVFNHSQLLTRIRFFSVEQKLSMRNRPSMPFSFAGLLLLLFFTVSLLSDPVKEILLQKETANSIITTSEAPALPESVAYASEPVINKPMPIKPAAVAMKKAMVTDETALTEDDAVALNDISPAHIQEIKVVPVSLTTSTEPANEGKEVIINEESSTGKMITRAYRVKLKGDVWVSEPLWVIAETKPKDSLLKKVADTTWKLKLVPLAQ